MDPAVLQAAQRVMAWRLAHTVLPSLTYRDPAAPPGERETTPPASRDTRAAAPPPTTDGGQATATRPQRERRT